MSHQANRRMPLSCEPCRERKIRCPRRANHGKGPCETCVRRGIPPSECVYLRDLYGRRSGPPPHRSVAASQGLGNAELMRRIGKLEEMMESHVRAGNQSASNQANLPSPGSMVQPSVAGFDTTESQFISPSSETSLSSLRRSSGRLVWSKSGHVRFVHSAGPRGLCTTQDCDGDLDDYADTGEIPLAMGSNSRMELLALLPPLLQCDQLKGIYLSVFAPLFHVLHDPTFEAEYNSFKMDPDSVPLSWLALLYATFSVAVLAIPDVDGSLLYDLGHRKTAAENMSLLFHRYRRAAMQCLEADHYLWRHNLGTLQTLILLVYGINQTHGQSWALLGTARNIALAIGCHVDPDALNLGLVAAEERRRAWAGLNMLYTIQNTTMGHLDTAPSSSDVKAPLDVDDCQVTDTANPSLAPQPGPSQMSYLILKFQLYEMCQKICRHVFDNSSRLVYGTVRELDAEIASKQEALNCKYLIDTTHAPLADYHLAHLNILFGYTHQLMLLLHRPMLMRGADGQLGQLKLTHDEWQHSRDRCVESSRALLGIHRMLHEDEVYRQYAWYNRGLGSFHAFHAVVCLAYILTNSEALSISPSDSIRGDIQSALVVFDQIEQSGLSTVCKRATPVIRKLLAFIDSPGASDNEPLGSSDVGFARSSLSTDHTEAHHTMEQDPSGAEFRTVMENLGSQPWLSPSTVNWVEWEAAMDIGRGLPVF